MSAIEFHSHLQDLSDNLELVHRQLSDDKLRAALIVDVDSMAFGGHKMLAVRKLLRETTALLSDFTILVDEAPERGNNGGMAVPLDLV